MSATIGPGPGAVHLGQGLGGVSKVVKKTPVYSFGGAGVERRQPTLSCQLTPAAAEYDIAGGLGAQRLSSKRTMPQYRIGRSTRDQAQGVYSGQASTLRPTAAPGPGAYAYKRYIGTDSPAYSFGDGDEIEGADPTAKHA